MTDHDELSEMIHNAAMGKPSGEAVFMSDVTECQRLADALLAAGYRKAPEPEGIEAAAREVVDLISNHRDDLHGAALDAWRILTDALSADGGE